MSSVFSQIIRGTVPSYTIAETNNCIAILDLSPLKKGHTLIIPKKEIDYLFDLNEEDYLDLMLFAKKVSGSIRNTIPCQRVGMCVMGFEIAHAHIHLIPMNNESDLNFKNEKLRLDKSEFETIAALIRKGF